MRIRLFLAVTSLGLVATGFGIQACGGDAETAAPPAQDAAVEATRDVSTRDVAEVDAAPECDPTKDFLAEIPDASIADGASTTGACVSCTKTHCSTQIDSCATDCVCQGVAGKALECYAKKQDVIGCFAPLAAVPKATQTIGLQLLGCVQGNCSAECAIAAFTDAGDASTD